MLDHLNNLEKLPKNPQRNFITAKMDTFLTIIQDYFDIRLQQKDFKQTIRYLEQIISMKSSISQFFDIIQDLIKGILLDAKKQAEFHLNPVTVQNYSHLEDIWDQCSNPSLDIKDGDQKLIFPTLELAQILRKIIQNYGKSSEVMIDVLHEIEEIKSSYDSEILEQDQVIEDDLIQSQIILEDIEPKPEKD